jgi:iron-sulfur cluster assembly protein
MICYHSDISLTPVAAEHSLKYLEKRGKGVGIRIGIKTTGCSGLMYVIEPVDIPEVEDIKYESNGVQVYVDPKSLVYVKGTQMDYVKKELNEGFEFKNPNTKGECGCGESFTV